MEAGGRSGRRRVSMQPNSHAQIRRVEIKCLGGVRDLSLDRGEFARAGSLSRSS